MKQVDDDTQRDSGQVHGVVMTAPNVGENAERDEWECDDDEPYCYRCDGAGEILVCPDDMCRGAGECIHGDGTVMCPACGGRDY